MEQNIPLLLAVAMVITLLVVYICLYTFEFGFPGTFEFSSIVNTSMPLAFVAVGQSVVLLTSGIDLSVGGLVSLSTCFAALYMGTSDRNIAWVTAVTLLIGAAAGLVNGLLVAIGRLQPIIVTLATLSIWSGLALYVLPTPGGAVPQALVSTLTGLAWGILPNGVIVALLLLVLLRVFRRTGLAMSLYAIGNDVSAARANGVSVVRAKVAAYVLCGLCSAAGGVYLAAVTTGGDPTTGAPFTLTSIAASVLGGVSLLGGRGSAIGAVLGAFMLTLLLNVLFFAHVSFYLQSFFQGLVLIVVVAGSAMLARAWRTRRVRASGES